MCHVFKLVSGSICYYYCGSLGININCGRFHSGFYFRPWMLILVLLLPKRRPVGSLSEWPRAWVLGGFPLLKASDHIVSPF